MRLNALEEVAEVAEVGEVEDMVEEVVVVIGEEVAIFLNMEEEKKETL